MGENPSNFYNDNVKYANPPSGGCNWDLDYYRTNYINAILLGQLKIGNYIKSGLVPTQGTGLNIDVTAGVAVIGGVEFEVSAFSLPVVVAPLGSVEFNLVYINSSGVAEVIQGDPITVGCALAIVDTDDTAILRFMDARSFIAPASAITAHPNKNAIINGGFDVWQRGDSQTSNGYGSDDRWFNGDSGSTKTVSKETFALGQTDVPNNPKYFSRTIITSVVGASNYVNKQQRIEDVRKLSDKTITLSFWAKADSAKNISIEFVQDFGTGGSPSSDVGEIGVQKIAITTSWAKYTVNVDMPSISGKTIGTDENDHTKSFFWFDAGSDFNTRTDSLGQQSGTFDIAQVQVEKGEVSTEFEALHISQILALCQRYYETGDIYAVNAPTTLTRAFVSGGGTFAVSKRVKPTMVYTSSSTPTINSVSGYSTAVVYTIATPPQLDVNGVFGQFQVTVSMPTNTDAVRATWTADSEL